MEVARQEDGGAVRGEPAAGRHRPQRRGARLLRDGPGMHPVWFMRDTVDFLLSMPPLFSPQIFRLLVRETLVGSGTRMT